MLTNWSYHLIRDFNALAAEQTVFSLVRPLTKTVLFHSVSSPDCCPQNQNIYMQTVLPMHVVT